MWRVSQVDSTQYTHTHSSLTHTPPLHTDPPHTHTPLSHTHSSLTPSLTHTLSPGVKNVSMQLVIRPSRPTPSSHLPCSAVRVAAPSNDQTTRLRNYLGRLICPRVNSANCCGPKALNECATERGLQRVKQFAVAKPVWSNFENKGTFQAS